MLGVDIMVNLMIWLDAANTVYDNMRSHTGSSMLFGTGVIVCKSSKQKLNTKFSIESEVAGFSNYIPVVIWKDFVLTYQGILLDTNKLFQDNQSAMKLDKNGNRSCGPILRHIHSRYFFVKNRLDT